MNICEKGVTSFEDYLNTFGSLTYRFRGVSMLPLLRQDTDIVTVVKKGVERCKRLDVVLYKRGKNYVLHRIVAVREKDYVILGDNCIEKETGITDDKILGVMTEVYRNGKKITTDSKKYRLFSHIWVSVYPLRRVYKTIRRLISGTARKILKTKTACASQNRGL